MDPLWGHLTIKMSGQPPFGAQVMLDGHEYVAVAAQGAGIDFTKDGNCFTAVADPNAWPGSQTPCRSRDYRAPEPGLQPVDLHRVPVLRSGQWTRGAQRVPLRLLGLPGRSTPGTCLFGDGLRMDRVFDTVVDRTRSRLNVTKLRTIFGAKKRPSKYRAGGLSPGWSRDRDTCVGPDGVQSPLRAADAEGLHQRRARAAVRGDRAQHQAAGLRPGAGQFPEIVTRLAGMAERFCTALDCVDIGFLPDGTLDRAPTARRSSAPPGSAAST